MWDDKTLAVVVPARNEERLIGRMLARVPSFVDSIIVVDDASTDRTSVRAASSGDPRVSVVRHRRNGGVGRAIVTGYRCALEAGAEVVVVMAGDDQMDPEDLPALVAAVASGRADYAKGNRFLHPERTKMPFFRRVAGAALSAATRAATGLRVDDSQCGYTAVASNALGALPLEDVWPRYGYPNDLLGLFAAHGMRVADVPVRPVYADEASGVRPWHVITVLGVIVRRYVLTRQSRQSTARATIASAHFSVWAKSKHRSRSAALSRPVTSTSSPSN
jgi:glycosyltransferase involved in cell wall biosynthesis